MGEKKSLQWIYYPTDHWVCLFVRFTDRLANFRSQDWKIFGQAPYRDDWHSLDCSQYSISPYKWLCSQALLSPNSRNESQLCDVFSEQFVGVLNDQYFNKQATLASTQASRTCTAHNCLQPDWLYLNSSHAIDSIKMCLSCRSRGFIMVQKDKSWQLDWFTTKGTFSLEEKTSKQNKSQYMPPWHQLNIKWKTDRNMEHRLLHRIRHLHISQNNTRFLHLFPSPQQRIILRFCETAYLPLC